VVVCSALPVVQAPLTLKKAVSVVVAPALGSELVYIERINS
jgi:hypothetical protein